MPLSRLLVLLATLVLACASAQAHVGAFGSAAESARRGFLPDLGAASRVFARVTAGRVWENYDCADRSASALCVDAFGNEIRRNGETKVEHLYRGEAFDPNVGFYYLRARWLDAETGRFTVSDPYPADPIDSTSLNRYMYVAANPVNFVDPLGLFLQIDGYAVEAKVEELYEIANPLDDVSYGLWWFGLKPDIQNHTKRRFMEIKPLSPSGVSKGAAQISGYAAKYGPHGYVPGIWCPEGPQLIRGRNFWFKNLYGVIFYTDNSALVNDLLLLGSFEDARRLTRRNQLIQTTVGLDSVMIATQNLAQKAIVGAGAALTAGILMQQATAMMVRM